MADIETDLYLAYENGYESGKKDATQKWISVKERLPEDKAFVLCKCRAGLYEVLSWIGASWYHDTNHCYMKGFVTHWMPLPEQPKEEN